MIVRFLFAAAVIVLPFSPAAAQHRHTAAWPNGKLKEQGWFDNDSMPTGAWMRWYENGQPSDSGEYVRLTRDMVVMIDPLSAAEIGKDTNAIKQEAISSQKQACTEKGKWKRWDGNGRLLEEGEYLPRAYLYMGIVTDGEGHILYPITYPVPIRTGTWRFYTDGVPAYEQEYKTQYGEGLRTEYYTSGKKKSEGVYNESSLYYRGVKREWDENGKLVKETTYSRYGDFVSEKTF